MVLAVIFLLVTVFIMPSFGQKVERIIIKGGPQFFESLKREVYQYPSFSTGVAYFKNGEVFPAYDFVTVPNTSECQNQIQITLLYHPRITKLTIS